MAMSIYPLTSDPPSETDSGFDRCDTDLAVDGELCQLCSVLDFEKVFFGSDDYKLPVTKANAFDIFRDCFCWFLQHIRKDSGCLLCRLVHQTLRCTPSFDSLEDGIVVARRSTLYSREKDESLPNFYVLNLEVSEGNELRGTNDYGVAIGVLGSHEMKLPNSKDECLRHFYPYLPQGMVPMFTTDEQAKIFDEWRDQTGAQYSLNIREINPFQVSKDMITGWLKTCEQEHTTWCKATLSQDVVVPNFRVIDVTTANIRPISPHCRYLALSYVWGKVHTNTDYLRLTRANHSELEKPGAINRYVKLLPDTIKDAIDLCIYLNERYLWIDSLCIIQDSPTEQKEQMSKMDTIYRHALLTIVAAAGDDANAGLPGVRSNLPRRSTPTARIQSLNLTALPRDSEVEVNTSTWNTRAWTFQERTLSTRLLRFTKNSITFECLGACWREDLELEGPDWDQFRLVEHDRHEQEIRENFHQIMSDDSIEFKKMVPREKYVNMFRNFFKNCYSPLVKDYTKRQLTNENDILDGFAGIQSALSRSLGPFYWGMPQHLLGQCLAWIATTEDMCGRPGFPSWSWAGWLFKENNNANYPNEIRGPCPDFTLFSNNGEMTYWNPDCIDDPYIGIRMWHDLLLYPEDSTVAEQWDEIMQAAVEDVKKRPDGTPLSSLIFFWTSTVRFQTGEGGKNHNSILKAITFSRYHRIGLLEGVTIKEHELQSILARPQPSWIGLAYIGSCSSSIGDYILALIRWTDGVARRILPHLLFTVSAEEWEKAHPQRSLIVLA